MSRAVQPSSLKHLDPALPVQQRVDALLAEMTLKEKTAQLGAVFSYDLLNENGFSAQKAAILAEGIGGVTRLGTYSLFTPRQRARAYNHIQAYLVEKTRLGIPAIFHDECCAGLAALGATRFPQMIGLASTFRPELAEAMGAAIRRQMRSTGSHQGLGPVLDIGRDPRWGRIEETFGEDPLLVTRFGVGYVRGLQGETLSDGVMATGKHFLAHSVSEGGLNCTPVHMGPREVRETYALPYEAVIREAGLATMMNSYSELDGRVVAADAGIMRGLLRDELGFQGLVVSDYLAIPMLHNFHYVAETLSEAAAKALRAGINQELPETLCYGQPLLAALECGNITVDLIDEAVRYVLTKKFELGLFDHPFVGEDAVDSIYADPAPGRLARAIAAESLTLLKNEGGILPLAKNPGTLAVIGPNADCSRCLLGDYSHAAMIDILLEGAPDLRPMLDNAGDRAGFEQSIAAIPTVLEAIRGVVSPHTTVLHAQGCDHSSAKQSGFADAVAAAQAADTVVLVLGDHSGLIAGNTTGEFNDCAGLELPGVQSELVQTVLQAADGKPVILVLINGRPLALSGPVERVPAVLEAWLPGEQGAPAVAGALFGDLNPGGKLPVSLPRSAGQLPVHYNRKPSGGRSHFRGDYTDLSTAPLYPFGHGLSYTRFEYANLTIAPEPAGAGTVQVAFDVQNTGGRQGDEVAQLYIRDEYACVPRPVKELKAFQRVTLEPGQAARITFTLTTEHLAYYDEDMNLILEPGRILVLVGSSSADIRLEGAFSVREKVRVKQRVTQVSKTTQLL